MRIFRAQRGRSLITDILIVQFVIAAAITAIALGGLSWTSRALIQNNLAYWAEQWAGELNELGTPFYLRDRGEAVLDVERFVEKYPEIRSVTWYRPDGAVFKSIDKDGAVDVLPPSLTEKVRTELSAKAGVKPAYLLRQDIETNRRFRLSGPVWVESFAADGLLDLDIDKAKTNVELLGFVAVDIDFSGYQTGFTRRLSLASIALIALLVISGLLGAFLLRRALHPLEELQKPLAEIAQGTRDVTFPTMRHKETRAIVTALSDTLGTLQKREEHLLHIADHDSLTGLYSRHRLVSELENEIADCTASGKSSGLCFVDLDQFKYINDTCGHPAGDQLLRVAAQQLRNAVRELDFVARFGGDEFVILLRDVSRIEAGKVCTQLLMLMRGLSHVEKGHAFQLQCSIGIAMITAHFDPHELIAHADMACQTAKANGRNRIEFYDLLGKQSERMTEDVDWIRVIRSALENNDFVLHYQPLLHLPTRTISHYEALLRLKTNRGLIGPQTFLPSVVRGGLINDIDRWVVENSIRALGEFSAKGSKMRLSVNLSTLAFEDSQLAPSIRSLLSEHHVSGDQLCFEITEQTAVRFAVKTDKQIALIRDMGCRLAVDDFGTGYSSFAYLKRLPVDFLKIDGVFIKELVTSRVDQSMVRLIGEIGKAAGLETVAEYVGSASTVKLLEKYGIDYAQGHYVGRAVPKPASSIMHIDAYRKVTHDIEAEPAPAMDELAFASPVLSSRANQDIE